MVHRLEIVGRLVAEPELRYTASGTPVLHVRVAVNDHFKGQDGEWKDEATFYDVSLWRQAAEGLSERLHKGDLVYVEGRPRARTYQGREGDTRVAVEVRFAHLVRLVARQPNHTDELVSTSASPEAPDDLGF